MTRKYNSARGQPNQLTGNEGTGVTACWSKYMSLAEASAFAYAFKLGMQIAIETLTE